MSLIGIKVMESMDLPLEINCASVQTMRTAADDFLLLDCREQSEYDLVHLDGSHLLPMSEIQQRLNELASYQSKSIIVYCHLGGRSLQVTQWLRHQGFMQAQSMAGGIDAWSVEIDSSLSRY